MKPVNEGSVASSVSSAPTRVGSNAAGLQKERIRLAAVQLFSRQGFAGTSVKQLAQALDTVPANLYNYYPNKEAILLDVLEHQLLAVIDRDREIMSRSDPPTEVLRSLVRDLVVSDLNDPVAAFVGIQGVRGLSDENLAYVSKLMGQVRGTWTELIAAGAQQGEFDVVDPKLTALSILTLCSSVSTWFRPGGEYSPQYVAESVAVMALRMAGAKDR